MKHSGWVHNHRLGPESEATVGFCIGTEPRGVGVKYLDDRFEATPAADLHPLGQFPQVEYMIFRTTGPSYRERGTLKRFWAGYWHIETPEGGRVKLSMGERNIWYVGHVTAAVVRACAAPGCRKPIDAGAKSCWMCGNSV